MASTGRSLEHPEKKWRSVRDGHVFGKSSGRNKIDRFLSCEGKKDTVADLKNFSRRFL